MALVLFRRALRAAGSVWASRKSEKPQSSSPPGAVEPVDRDSLDGVASPSNERFRLKSKPAPQAYAAEVRERLLRHRSQKLYIALVAGGLAVCAFVVLVATSESDDSTAVSASLGAGVAVLVLARVTGLGSRIINSIWRLRCPDCGEAMIATRFTHHRNHEGETRRSPDRFECHSCDLFVDWK
jgi:hypothetical protein